MATVFNFEKAVVRGYYINKVGVNLKKKSLQRPLLALEMENKFRALLHACQAGCYQLKHSNLSPTWQVSRSRTGNPTLHQELVLDVDMKKTHKIRLVVLTSMHSCTSVFSHLSP